MLQGVQRVARSIISCDDSSLTKAILYVPMQRSEMPLAGAEELFADWSNLVAELIIYEITNDHPVHSTSRRFH